MHYLQVLASRKKLLKCKFFLMVRLLHFFSISNFPLPSLIAFVFLSRFWNKWNMPHCLGAIHGKHIQIQSPKASGSLYFNYKKTFSTNLMAVADAEYAFIAVDVGGEGSLHDSAVFKDSLFGQKFENKRLKLPKKEIIPGTNIELDYFFVGDGAFQLRCDLMKPYAARKLSMKEAIYNYRISRARRFVENAFGILVALWRIFRQPLCCSVETADLIVLAAVCLHNFIIRSRDPGVKEQYMPDRFCDEELSDGSIREGTWRNHVAGEQGALLPAPSRARKCSKSATEVREFLAEYFSGVGTVSWQQERVKRRFWGANITATARAEEGVWESDESDPDDPGT